MVEQTFVGIAAQHGAMFGQSGAADDGVAHDCSQTLMMKRLRQTKPDAQSVSLMHVAPAIPDPPMTHVIVLAVSQANPDAQSQFVVHGAP